MWKVGGNPNLPIDLHSSWDAGEAAKAIWKWAYDKEGDDIVVARARQAFVFYDSAHSDLKGSYKEPFATIKNGKPTAVAAAIRNAKARLALVNDVPADVKAKGEKFLDGYMARIHKAQGKENQAAVGIIVESCDWVAEETEDPYVRKVQLIAAGQSKNGRIYPAELLKASASKFEGVRSFSQHFMFDDSLAVVGWITDVAWDESGQALVGQYHFLESHPLTGRVLEAIKKGVKNLFGLSIAYKGEIGSDSVVTKIDEAISVDIVPLPAAKGQFLEQQDIGGTEEPQDTQDAEDNEEEDTHMEQQEQMNDALKQTVQQLQTTQKRLAQLERKNRITEAFSTAQLNKDQKSLVTALLEGKDATEDEISAAISMVVSHYPKPKPSVQVTMDEMEKRGNVAVATMLGETYEGEEPLQSIYQLYELLSGRRVSTDSGDHSRIAYEIIRALSGYNPDLVVEGTVNWSDAWGNAINRAIMKTYKGYQYDSWRQLVSSTRPFKDMRPHTAIDLGMIGPLQVVTKDNPYQNLAVGSDRAETVTPAKFGGLYSISWEDIINDDIGSLRRIPKYVAFSAALTVYKVIADILNGNPNMADGTPVWDATRSNTGTDALSYDNMLTAWNTVMNQTYPGLSDYPMLIEPKYLVIPTQLWQTAKTIRDSKNKPGDLANPNILQGQFEYIVFPTLDTAGHNDWLLFADPKRAPTIELGFLGGRDRPEVIAQPAGAGENFTSDKVTFKVRFVTGAAVVSPYTSYKSVVANS